MGNQMPGAMLEPVKTTDHAVASGSREFLRDLQQGLAQAQKGISPKHFYDARGSALFDRICELPEYYPTRTELAILQSHASDIGRRVGPGAEIVEFGAGSLRKVRLLLDALQRPLRYVPIDISGEHLQDSAGQLRALYPALDVVPLVADYTQPWELPAQACAGGGRLGFFPGSTIGNFTPEGALHFLQAAAHAMPGGALLIGADLVKHPDLLHAAYNDSQGVTAAFNLNLLERANRELGADFRLHQFDHSAFYNAPQRRIEMHLVSNCRQSVRVGGALFSFDQGETLHTENSCKFSIDGLQQLARQAGLKPGPVWTDPNHWFCLQWLDIPLHLEHP